MPSQGTSVLTGQPIDTSELSAVRPRMTATGTVELVRDDDGHVACELTLDDADDLIDSLMNLVRA